MSFLSLRSLQAGYGDTKILNGIDIDVDAAEIVVLIGPNGAGKSTAMKAVFGLAKIYGGDILFDGKSLRHLSTSKLVRHGICYVPQTENVFPSLTVRENLEMGAFSKAGDFRSELREVYQIFPILEEKQRRPASTLSGGQQQMLAMGRALMVKPRLLLLDEPTAGVSPLLVEQILGNIRQIARSGIAVFMVEQNARQALRMADRGYVLAMGTVRCSDTAPNLLANPEIAELFLGA
jgi:branched-chain amino acid transport system ATP-binding protein